MTNPKQDCLEEFIQHLIRNNPTKENVVRIGRAVREYNRANISRMQLYEQLQTTHLQYVAFKTQYQKTQEANK